MTNRKFKNDEHRSDDSPEEARLVELACKIEERLAIGDYDSVVDSYVNVEPSHVAELRQAERAIAFLNQARHNIQQLAGIAESAIPESIRMGADSTLNVTSESVVGSPSSEDSPRQFGRFEILDVLGQGGFAKVFLARDPDLDRLVALKIPHLPTFQDEAVRRRFAREARAAAVLSHPSIVPIFETGTHGITAYIAFGYCPGPNLAEWFAQQQRSIPAKTAAAIVAKLAEAAEHAHQRGIVHRDLKPGNVLLHEGDAEADRAVVLAPTEQLADRVRITDFGLARIESSYDESLTLEGAVVGTPAYMSPEQARGLSQVGAASDIFSLGSILYELLTGQRPFSRDSHLATLRAIENEEPTSLQNLVPSVPKDLESICLKCLRKSRRDRYATAYELAADLERWLKGVPVTARPVSARERTVAWSRRKPATGNRICVGRHGGGRRIVGHQLAVAQSEQESDRISCAVRTGRREPGARSKCR